MFNNQDSDTDDWPESVLGQKFDSFEQNLMCPICQGHYNNPQILNCGHSYCSICIRKHFDKTLNRTSSDICPSCREKADSADLKVNRTLASIVSSFKKLRKELHSTLTANETENSSDVEIVENPKNKKVCNQARDAASTVITQRIPHYSFHGLSKDKVKKTIEKLTENCKVKLRMDGDKDVLERRLREVIHLNNAQINALQPLTLDQVVRLVNDGDNAKDAEAKKSARSVSRLEKFKGGEAVRELDDGFARLAKVRSQRRMRHRPVCAY